MKKSGKTSKRHFVWMLCIGFVANAVPTKVFAADDSPPNAAEPGQSPRAPIEERMDMEPVLTALVQEHLAKEERLAGQQSMVSPRIWYSEEGDTINIDLGRAYLPTHYTLTFEERVNGIAAILYEAEKPTPIYKVDVWFDGKDIFDYFPEERGPADRAVPKATSMESDNISSHA
ncbi:hypothetical protein [Luteibacter sp.]|jgi:hypothetical protein|uniref:hypothetical protein n=1 Tax=Luteibacter sp. TaxID=1886636 RepID=UPI002F42148A